MTKAVECFGEYMLQEIRKQTEGNKRVDVPDLFSCISSNQNQLWFLECLIDEYNYNKEEKHDTGHHNKKAEPQHK